MSRKGKIILSVVSVVISMALLIISAFVSENAVISPVASGVLVAFSVALVLVAVSFALKVDYETGVYKCRKCGNVFKPTFRAYLFGPHTLTTRCLKCPRCKETSWCKRKMDN